MSSAKALANGFPMGAMLATEEVGSHLTPGSHASTFGGTALASAVALATLREIRAALPGGREGRRAAAGPASRGWPAAGSPGCAAAACCSACWCAA